MFGNMGSNSGPEENAGDILKVQPHGIGLQGKLTPFIGPGLQKQPDSGIATGLQPGAIRGRRLRFRDNSFGGIYDLVEAYAHALTH
jgi:hypothetical protein